MDNPFKNLHEQLIKKEDEADYAELGRFITAFASAEAAVHMLARKLSSLSDEKARIIFGGMRLSDLIDRIRAIMRHDGIDSGTYADVDACLSQLNIVADRRHRLVHRSSTYYAGHIVVTDVMTAKHIANIQVEKVPYDELSAMHGDCLAIYARLARVANPANQIEPAMLTICYQPWRYKPVPPDTPNKPPQKAPVSQKPPPDASQA